MTTYFLSDIHLHAAAPENSQLLLNFLQTSAQHADAIYILGDLFALWLGDDLEAPYADDIILALKQLTAKNIPVYFMHGNRDFLIGQKFCAKTGCVLLNDPTVINLYGQQVLLTHGDLLCTRDTKYQNFRKFVQNPVIKYLFLALPKFLRSKIGTWVKQQAKNTVKINDPSIYDVNPDTVKTWAEKYFTTLIIHGHTHKPAVHEDAKFTRIVLGDWSTDSAQIAEADRKNVRLVDLVLS